MGSVAEARMFEELDRIREELDELRDSRERNLQPLDADTLCNVAEATALYTGAAFFNTLAKRLASVLNVRCAFIAEFVEGSTKVNTLAFLFDGELLDNFEYELAGTPCEKVLEGRTCRYPTQVANSFPHHREELEAVNAESYLGVPLMNATGEVLGHLAVIDDRPMHKDPVNCSILRIFAARAAGELERSRADRLIRESEERLARVFASAMDAIISIDENRVITMFNEAAETMFLVGSSDVVGEPFLPMCTPRLEEIVTAFILQTAPCGPEASYRVSQGITALRMSGEEFPAEVTLCRTEAGARRQFTIFVRDVGQQHRDEAKIRQLDMENTYLREEISEARGRHNIIGGGARMAEVYRAIDLVAKTNTTVFVGGGTGTGKELIARAIHQESWRAEHPLIKVNCAVLAAGVVESELFGHEKGAFTSATSRRMGRFELAHNGTIFLDEVGELSLETQAKLLRVLQEGEFERVGGEETVKVDVRVIAATNRDLRKAVAAGTFREDLYYRLNVFPIVLPPLRARAEDIPALVNHFIGKHAGRIGREITSVEDACMERLREYPWPGNIRELEHVMERAIILCEDGTVRADDLALLNVPVSAVTPLAVQPEGDAPPHTRGSGTGLNEVQREHILRVLNQCGWVIEGRKGAATALSLHPNTLRSRMKKLGIRREKK